jgi:hypothetical protein
MKQLAFILLISLIFIASECEQPAPIIVDCEAQVDSTDKYWKDVIKNLVTPDTVWMVRDSINWIDSLRIKDSTAIQYIVRDSIILRDSLVIRDSISLRDSVVYVLWESFEIPISEVKVDTHGSDMVKENLIDDKLYYSSEEKGTRWGASGYPHQIMLSFDTTYVVTEIWINVFGWDKGLTHTLDIYSYADKIKSITTYPELWSRHQLLMVGRHIYIEVVGGENDWTDIAEIRVLGSLKID